jgi:5-methylcytosine-specific restriction endonuclease McrA
MSKQRPNQLQKWVRSVIRELINQANDQNACESPNSKRKEVVKKPRSKQQASNRQNLIKRSRSISASKRVLVLNRDGYKCVFCGRTAKQVQLEVDHIVPFSPGGNNDLQNLQTLCFDCNRGKGTLRL